MTESWTLQAADNAMTRQCNDVRDHVLWSGPFL